MFCLQDAAKESRMKFSSLLEDLLAACDRRTGIYSSFDCALDDFKKNRDNASFANATKKLKNDYATVTQTISDISTAMMKEDPESSDKVSNVT